MEGPQSKWLLIWLGDGDTQETMQEQDREALEGNVGVLTQEKDMNLLYNVEVNFLASKMTFFFFFPPFLFN